MNVDSCGSEQVEEGGVGNFVAAGEAGQRGGGHFTSLGCVGARDSVCVGARGDEEVRRSSSVVRVCVRASDLGCDDDDILAEAPWDESGPGKLLQRGGCAMWRAAGSVRCGDMA